MADSHTRTPDIAMVQSDDLHDVLSLLAKMDPREAAVLRMRFGLDDEEPKTLKEIGELLVTLVAQLPRPIGENCLPLQRLPE